MTLVSVSSITAKTAAKATWHVPLLLLSVLMALVPFAHAGAGYFWLGQRCHY